MKVKENPAPGKVWRTLDGVRIEDELRVWDYDLRAGWIDLGRASFETNQNTGEVSLWFDVVHDNEDGTPGDGSSRRRKSMSHDRVWVRHPYDRKEA